jgi:hypothetical protein
MHMSGLMSTLVRTIVNVVLSANATVIFAGSLVPSALLISVVRACSSTAGGGARMILTLTVALDAFALSTIAFCVSSSCASSVALISRSRSGPS